MYFPGRPWALIKKFLGVRKHPTAIIMDDYINYIHFNFKYGYSYRDMIKNGGEGIMLRMIIRPVKQTELISTIDNTSKMFSIKIPKYFTKYELSMIRKRKYIEVVQIILKPKKDEHYYQIVIVPVQNNLKYNQTVTWKDKEHKDKFIISL